MGLMVLLHLGGSLDPFLSLVGHGVIFTLGWLDKLDAGRPLRGGASIQLRPVFVQFSSSSKAFEIYGEIFASGRGELGYPVFVHPERPARVQRQKSRPNGHPKWSAIGRVLVSPFSTLASADTIAFTEILCFGSFGFNDFSAY